MTAAAWQRTAEVLADAGCGLVVGLPSDEPGLLDAAAAAGMSALPVRDQRLGACALAGYWAVAGRPAILAVDSGPSFTNALTGLLETMSLRTPAVVVTTRIAIAEIDRGGFQHLDQTAMARPVTKWTFTVERPEQLTWALRRAVHLAVNGLPGVVLVEIAREVLQAESGWTTGSAGPISRLRSVAADEAVDRAAALIAGARRPVLIAGGGAKAAGAGPELLRLAERIAAPVFTTASGRGTIDETHHLACGLAGLYTTPPAERLLAEADLVLAVGSRLEETARMGWEIGSRPLIQIDADPAAFTVVAEPAAALLGDPKLTLERLLSGLYDYDVRPSGASAARVADVKAELLGRHPGRAPADGRTDALDAPTAIALATRAFGTDLILLQENGLADIWGYHYPVTEVRQGVTVVAPGEQTMVGFGLGAALGACLAAPDRPALLVCGDGAVEMSLAALPTIAEQRFGISILMMDNRGYGWPRLARAGAPGEPLTRFGQASHADAVVASLGGVVLRPTAVSELSAALETARGANSRGVMALIAVPIEDDDVPAGIRRVFLGEDPREPA